MLIGDSATRACTRSRLRYYPRSKRKQSDQVRARFHRYSHPPLRQEALPLDRSAKATERRQLSAALWAVRTAWPESPRAMLGVLACTLVRGLVPAGFALAIRGLINAATVAAAAPAAGAGPGPSPDHELGFGSLLLWIIIALAVTLLDAAATLLQQFFSERLRGDLNLALNSSVLRHAVSLDLPYFENGANRGILEHIQRDPGSRLHQFLMEGQKSALAAFQSLSLVLILVWLEPLILPATALLALPFLLFQWRLARTRFLAERARTKKRRWTRWYLLRLTSPETIGEVKLLGIGELLAERFAAAMREFRDQDRRLQFRQLQGGGLFAGLTSVLFFGLFARIAYRVLEGALTVGDLAIFGGAVVRLRGALDSGIRAAAIAYEQGLFMAVLRDFLLAAPVVADQDRAPTAATATICKDPHSSPTGGAALTVEGLCFSYPGSERPVLREVSFDLAAGETIAIVGENGSGKSTLAKLLVRLYDPDRGSIQLDGRPLTHYPLIELHAQVSLLAQAYGRYEASMAENIAYGDWERLRDDRAEIERLAELTGVADIARQLPDGLDTALGREFSDQDLSGGQWQRLAITRALARPGRLLILDEPTSNIDARAEHALFAAVAEAARGRTTIIISHRFSTLRIASRILVMHQGRIVEQGTHAALLAANGRYAALYRLHEHYRIADPAMAGGA